MITPERREYLRKWWRSHKEYNRRNSRRWRINHPDYYHGRAEVHARRIQELGGACQVCGYNRCLSALHLHHKDPRTKKYVRDWLGDWKKDKYIVLCANCHAILHYCKRKGQTFLLSPLGYSSLGN